MTQAAHKAQEASIRVNGQAEPLVAATLAALIEEKAIDVGQRGIAVALIVLSSWWLRSRTV